MTPSTTNAFAYPVDQLPSLATAGRRRFSRRFGKVMLLLLAVAPVVLAFAPWQQNLAGIGRVIAFDPVDRPMPMQARTDGLLLQWHVQEGQLVNKGDPLVDLADNDPEILLRLQQQVEAAERKIEAAKQKREQFQLQIADAEAARDAAIRYADDEIAAAVQEVEVKKQAVAAADQKVQLSKFALEMWEGMVRDRIGSGFDLQKARQEYQVAEAELVAKRAEVSGAEAKLRATRSARVRIERSEQVKVQDTKAKRDAADGDVAEAEGSLPKLQRDLQRQQQQRITAPISGYVQNMVQNGQGGGFVKQGTTLLLLVPDARQLAVELQIDGNDVTFLEVGRHVRLQFEGYPAIQWVGWPSLAVGSFGGTVAFVDRFDDGTGNFRVMVLPDERPFEPEGVVVDWLRHFLTYDERRLTDNPHAWPRDYLRQGVRAKGWIVLDRVSLGFEIWRQLNGFPPTVAPPKKGTTGNSGEGVK